MITVGQVFAEIVQVFTTFIPRAHDRPKKNVRAIYDTFLFGVQEVNWRPVLYVPVFDTVENWPRHRQLSSAEATIQTEELGSTRLGAEFFYTILDPVKCRTRWGEEHDDHLQAIVRGALVDYHDDTEAACKACEFEFTSGGCEIHSIKIEDYCATIPLRHFQD